MRSLSRTSSTLGRSHAVEDARRATPEALRASTPQRANPLEITPEDGVDLSPVRRSHRGCPLTIPFALDSPANRLLRPLRGLRISSEQVREDRSQLLHFSHLLVATHVTRCFRIRNGVSSQSLSVSGPTRRRDSVCSVRCVTKTTQMNQKQPCPQRQRQQPTHRPRHPR